MIVVHAQTKHRSYPTFGDLLSAVLEYFGDLSFPVQQEQEPKEA